MIAPLMIALAFAAGLAAHLLRLPPPWPATKLMKALLDRVGHGDLQVHDGACLALVIPQTRGVVSAARIRPVRHRPGRHLVVPTQQQA